MPGWNPRSAHARPLLIGFFAALLGILAMLVIGPPATPTPLICTDEVRREVRLPPQPRAVGGAHPELIAAGNKLSLRGRLDAAARLYDRALALENPDQRAGLGLAYVQARRALAVDREKAGERTLRAGHDDEAAACFRLSLVADRGNQAARDALEQLRAPDARSLAQQLAGGWDAFYERWLAPAARALLPFLGAVAVLLVLARLLTPVAVPGDALAWRPSRRSAAWWTGLALLTVAALRMTAFAGRGPSAVEQAVASRYRLAVVVALLTAAALLLHRSRSCSRRTDRWVPPVLLAPLVLATLLAAVRLVPSSVGIPDGVWPWALSASLAVLGVTLVALGRGHALRLQVTVKQAEKADPAGTAYVLARLEELGTSPPEGLKAPQQLDVTDLPTDALMGLPAGKVAAALTTTLGLLRASVPWRAVVADTGEDRMVVTVTRNGEVVRTAIVDGERFRGASSSSSDDDPAADATRDPRNLLTAAAAVILTELAVRHPRLGRGLCGATQWDSVAAHVVATRPALPPGQEAFELQLLAFAVQRDPRNALARAAYVQRMTKDPSSRADFHRQAERLHGLLATIQEQRCTDPAGRQMMPEADDGYLPLRLRTQHALTAACLNAAVAEGGDLSDSVRANAALREFRRLLSVCASLRMSDPFIAELDSVARELAVAITVVNPARTDTGFPGRDAWWRPRSVHALYDRACALAVDSNRSGPLPEDKRKGRRDLALEDLRLAAGLRDLKDQAHRDPWLRHLREGTAGDDVAAGFWTIVGPPARPFTDLPPFGEKGTVLRALGLTGPRELFAATNGFAARSGVADRLRVPGSVVMRWFRLAELAKPPATASAPSKWLDSRQLGILLEAGISSIADLPTPPPAGQLDPLRAEVDKAAARLGTHRLTPEELSAVRARA